MEDAAEDVVVTPSPSTSSWTELPSDVNEMHEPGDTSLENDASAAPLASTSAASSDTEDDAGPVINTTPVSSQEVDPIDFYAPSSRFSNAASTASAALPAPTPAASTVNAASPGATAPTGAISTIAPVKGKDKVN